MIRGVNIVDFNKEIIYESYIMEATVFGDEKGDGYAIK